jgi:probable phosphoglycerate mutase
MESNPLRRTIIDNVWSVVDRQPNICSATIAGSFSRGAGIEGIADIDTILVVDGLDGPTFSRLQQAFSEALEPPLAAHGYRLRINPTLGPLKFNDPQTAVLHLMMYGLEAHREHAVKSPFTCLDWQRSPLWRKASLAHMYPVFGLQPHHFINARRGARDYLGDLAAGMITFREPVFDGDGYRELKRQKPMTSRDRQEFAYHVMRFLMQNVLKLLRRQNTADDGKPLLEAYFGHFPVGSDEFCRFYRELARRKQKGQFDNEDPDLLARITRFVELFEQQFCDAFHRDATRHLVFRHAPTALNAGEGSQRRFQGRIDPPVSLAGPHRLDPLTTAAQMLNLRKAYASPLNRAMSSLQLLAERVPSLPAPQTDPRLHEIAYGRCEGLTVAEARQRHPELFVAWSQGIDAHFPDGENHAEVLSRVLQFAQDRWRPGAESSVTCTHNVVLRCLVGHLLGVPQDQWYRLRIPHLTPVHLVSSSQFGLFVDLDESVEREIFADFDFSKGDKRSTLSRLSYPWPATAAAS